MIKLAGLRGVFSLAVLVLLVSVGAAFAAAPKFPPLTGRVVDNANILSPEVEAKLTTELATLESQTGRQLVVGSDLDWTLRRVDVSKETSWTQGRLIFMHDPLSKAVADVNRYSTRKLVFEGGAVPDRQIVGVFEAGDVEGFVKAIELQGIAHRTTSTSDEILLVGDE